MKKTFLDFKKWVKNIQTAGYNGARTVHITKWPSNDVIAVTGQKLNKGVPVKWAKLQENPAPNVA